MTDHSTDHDLTRFPPGNKPPKRSTGSSGVLAVVLRTDPGTASQRLHTEVNQSYALFTKG